jgi:hypothetical protein
MDTDVAPSRRESSVGDPYRMLGITCAEPPIPTKPVFRCTPPPGEPPATMWQIYHRHSSPPNSRALPSSRTQTSCAMWSEAAKWLEKFPGGGRDRRGRRWRAVRRARWRAVRRAIRWTRLGEAERGQYRLRNGTTGPHYLIYTTRSHMKIEYPAAGCCVLSAG